MCHDTHVDEYNGVRDDWTIMWWCKLQEVAGEVEETGGWDVPLKAVCCPGLAPTEMLCGKHSSITTFFPMLLHTRGLKATKQAQCRLRPQKLGPQAL